VVPFIEYALVDADNTHPNDTTELRFAVTNETAVVVLAITFAPVAVPQVAV
jgi:hypothetical protein